ncbi:winged helix-turn-helix domain-containing protein [Haloarchaeobius litoreus]|uniref:Winged helix-turn-helix domain-containing protein n=1 Tax=Haloarchaeobius litoreus TaxID=755306 RepID=A0ABD6DGY5_9EURY|nr:winged helix-turn-helix domain-containing protein [Haloarchaeobius litoreus]
MNERLPAHWMVMLDERILEYLDSKGLSSPGLMSKECSFNAKPSRVRERCKVLTYAGLIAPLSREHQVYEITSQGQEYLAGELDARYRPNPHAVRFDYFSRV